MLNPAIAVMTRKSAKEIIEAGGSAAWVLNPDNAALRRYLVCCRNQYAAEFDSEEPHGAAFLVGRIGEFEPVGTSLWDQTRYKICITECARVIYLDAWKGWRNPVRYTTLEDLGIDINQLAFTRLEEALDVTVQTAPGQPVKRGIGRLTIAEAKEGLAATLGISPDAIEIIIRA